MTALKGRAIEDFLRRPDRRLALIYGPDAGLVAERAAVLLSSCGAQDDLSRVVMEGDSLASEPHRLVEEAWTVPLFGGVRTIRVTATGRNLMPAIEPMLANPPDSALVVVEAGELRPSSPLRRAFERAETAAAVPCYADDAGAIDRLIDETMRAAGLDVASDARALLHVVLGGDRLASRGELEKLALYCRGATRVEAADVAAISGDTAAMALDELADAAGLGDADEADRLLARALAAGLSHAAVTGALARHFLQLAEARHQVEEGATADAAMRDLRPQVFFRRHPAFRRQLGVWRPADLARALDVIAETELQTRRRPDLADLTLSRCALVLAVGTRPGRRGR